MLSYKPFTASLRKEVDVELEVIEGTLPSDIFGHVFVQSPCGTVNYPFPIPEKNPDGSPNKEYGGPLFNGDGMMMRFDFDQPGKLRLKTRIMKTPCYYADLASKMGTELHEDGYHFRSMGISRISFKLGSRNQLNTAVTPFQLPGDPHPRITANFDMGRPYEFDPKTLELITPIGQNKEWKMGVPKFMNYVFPLHQTTAHPSFDPRTGEYFTVNFIKTMHDMFWAKPNVEMLLMNEEELEKRLEKLVDEARQNQEGKLDDPHIREMMNLINQPDKLEKEHSPWWKKVLLTLASPFTWLWRWVSGMNTAVYILRWTGQGKLGRWKVLDEKGKPIRIVQTMHQTNLCRDYIILIDASFKIALDIMLTNPFPHNKKIDAFLREVTARVTEPRTATYVIRRKDLNPKKKTVKSKSTIIPIETVHFSLNYENPDGQITLHGAHNTALCAAEWIRPYDILAVDNDKEALPNTVGLMTCGEMDIGRFGKFVIDGELGDIVDEQQCVEEGFLPDGSLGAHTWAVGLHSFKNIISYDQVVAEIKNIYWQSYGLDPRILTEFIMRLYMNYENRIIPVHKILEYTKRGIPFALVRQNTDSMKLEDYHLFEMNQNFRSIQFVPRRQPKPEGVEDSMWGYIFCTMINGQPDFSGDEYSREIWIFDASELKKGPICKLSHPDLDFAFTIHSTWMERCESPGEIKYKIGVREDYQPLIKKILKPWKRRCVQEMFDKEIYPHFE
ncbi:MAG: hypothetical protein HC842_01300 [Cytophagales bacterium]|nr:hypothetical protein [Cytophagales bacterium]